MVGGHNYPEEAGRTAQECPQIYPRGDQSAALKRDLVEDTMPLVAARNERTAADQAERAIARLFLAARAGQLAFSIMMVGADRRRYKRAWLQFALLAGTVAESAWLAHRLLRAERYQDRTAMWVDTAWAGAGLVASGTALGDTNTAPWMKNVAIGATLGAASSENTFERVGAVGVMGCAAALAGIRAGGRDSHVAGGALAVNDIISWIGMHIAVSTYIAAHRKQASLQDSANLLAVEKATAAAKETERGRQYRLVHERTLEVLRTLAETDDEHEAGVLARQEAGRLRYFLRTKGHLPTGLEQGLREVAEAVEADGLHVELVTAELESDVGPDAVRAIREAALVSLLAAKEHSGASRAVLRSASEPGAVTVTVRHHSGGFEPGGGSSYERRLEVLNQMMTMVGADAQVWSSPGGGVRVTLVVPVSAAATSVETSDAQSSADDATERLPDDGVGGTPAGHGNRARSEHDLHGRIGRYVVGGPHDDIEAPWIVADRDVSAGGKPFEPGPEQRPAGHDSDGRVAPHDLRMSFPRSSVLVRNTPIARIAPADDDQGSSDGPEHHGPNDHRPDDERTRAHQTTASLFLAWRFSGLATGVAALVAGRRRYRSSTVGALTVAGTVAESIWLAWRIPRNAYRFDRPAQGIDLLTAAAVLLIGRANLDVEDRWTWINWTPWSFGANAVCGRALDPEDTLAGLLGAAALIGVCAAQSTRWTDRIVNSGGMAACFGVAQVFTRQVHNAATRLQVTRAEAIDEGRRLAVEQERSRQLRLLHDSALQTLEAVGTGRYPDLGLLRRLAQDEAERLETELNGVMSPARSLRDELELLVADHVRQGLDIELRAQAFPEPAAGTVYALRDAANEALTNVRKHAQSRHVDITVETEDQGLVKVVIADDGVGFEPAVGLGFGTTHSITERMSEIGGRAEIHSRPRRGTKVSLWGPR